MSSKNLIIFDSDSLAYLGSADDTLDQILTKVDTKIQEVLDETKADYYVLLISRGKYFRHDISKTVDAPKGTYKSKRTYGAKIWVNTIKEYLIAKYKAVWYPKLEADDMAAWLMNQELKINVLKNGIELIDNKVPDSNQIISTIDINKILVAMDKDLLCSIPGRHLNFHKKLGFELWGMQWVDTKEPEASFFQWDQMIIGDTSDGVAGLYNKGKAWCKKNSEGKSLEEWIHFIFQEYISEYGLEQGIFEFQKGYRLLHMLDSDSDMIREVGYIPELPEFQKVIKNNNQKIEF